MAVRLPIDSIEPHSRREVQLDGASFTMDLDWNDREQGWHVSLYTAAGEPLIEGHRVVIGGSPLRRVTKAGRPGGDIIFVDTSGTQEEPGRDDLGARVVALYYDATEIQALLDAAG